MAHSPAGLSRVGIFMGRRSFTSAAFPSNDADLVILFRHLGTRTPEQTAVIHDRLFDESAIGHMLENEVLYAAELVLARIQQF